MRCGRLGGFHRRLLLHRGIGLADAPITAAERRVLDLLLSDRTEQDIAADLRLAPSTVHTYATRIYRKFNVRGRAGLVASWLGGNRRLQPPLGAGLDEARAPEQTSSSSPVSTDAGAPGRRHQPGSFRSFTSPNRSMKCDAPSTSRVR